MTATSRPARRTLFVRLAAYAALLFASWNHNLLGIPDGMFWSRAEPRSGYLGSESHLVICRVAHAADLHPLHPLCGPAPDGGVVPYTSQVGLTGIGLAAITNLTGLPSSDVVTGAGAAFTLLTALLVAAVFASAQRWLGPPTGDVACVLAASTTVFLPFAPSLYWVPWLLLAPFAVVWCFFPKANTPRRRIALYAAVGLAVTAKALCGYEYITTVILAPVAAAWFHQHRAAEPLGRRFRTAAALVGVGLLGFAAAMALHVAQLGAVMGVDGVAVIRDRAVSRTATDPGAEASTAGVPTASPSRLTFAVRCFLGYFDQRAVSVAGGFGRVQSDVPLKAVVALAGAFVVAAGVGRARLPRDAGALGGAVLLGFAASLSWQVLAVNHMCVHRHLNLIVFAVPFLPVAYLAAGYVARRVAGERLNRRFGPVLLAGVGVVMGVNLFTAFRQQAAEDAEQHAAEAAVAARLGEPFAPAGGLGGSIDTARTASRVPDPLLTEYGLLDRATGLPTDPGALVLTGWVLGECKTTARPLTRIVVTRGAEIVPSAVLRFRRPDIEAPVGRALAGSGFVAVVPSAEVRSGQPVRVFVASTNDPAQVLELAVR